MVRNRTITATTPHPMASEVSSWYWVDPYDSTYSDDGTGLCSVSIFPYPS